ncbi:uncharacterized protein LOC5515741 [Nematostella vectensis]|uniref:uncharacterized protein LOC5515741 n=1 Tax=Nematostella vectensis TaxID=45351 RepID=UPI002076F5CD|nr:uncharacterized protein LOC5515741 [Nematostella vectensis]
MSRDKKLFFVLLLVAVAIVVFFSQTSLPDFMKTSHGKIARSSDDQMDSVVTSQIDKRALFKVSTKEQTHASMKTQADDGLTSEETEIEKAVDAEWQSVVQTRNTTMNPTTIQPISAAITGKAILNGVLGNLGDAYGGVSSGSRCDNIGLRKYRKHKEKPKCVAHMAQAKYCKLAHEAYKTHKKPLTCADRIDKSFCVFRDSWRESKETRVALDCDVSPCGGNPVYVLNIDPIYGILEPVDKWYEFSSAAELQDFLPDYVIKTSMTGSSFCFLRCKSKLTSNRIIKQILLYPPVMPRLNRTKSQLLNFNVIVLDSVSRAHFYRLLPKSVDVMRSLAKEETVAMLDFELLQNTSPSTLSDIKAFMSGEKTYAKSYNTDTLYGQLKKKGYFTLVQEDSCWYDKHGCLLIDYSQRNSTPSTWSEFAQWYDAFTDQVGALHIDDLGLMPSACEVYQQYGTTNQIDKPRRVCFGGKVYADYYFDYARKVFDAQRDSGGITPVFAYTRLGTGNEVTGSRIKQIDTSLARFLQDMATKSSTLTMILSTHGPKNTKYALHTMEGRSEIYDSLLYMIVPENAAEILGRERMEALVTNQKRLVTTMELHYAIVSTLTHVGAVKEGVFRVIPDRTCADISIKSFAICKCEGWEKHFTDNHESFAWLAERALGKINNVVQKKFMKTHRAGGYGQCQRLVGHSFEKIHRRKEKNHYIVTMDLVVVPDFQIFEVQIKYPLRFRVHRNAVGITGLRRVSTFNHYAQCVDTSVPTDMCVCNSRRKTKKRKHPWDWLVVDTRQQIMAIINRSRMFGVKTNVEDLHASCLMLLSRKHGARIVVFELANACDDRKYEVRMIGKSKGVSVTSRDLPFSLTLKPLTVHFLFSVYHVKRPYGFFLKTSYSAYIRSSE